MRREEEIGEEKRRGKRVRKEMEVKRDETELEERGALYSSYTLSYCSISFQSTIAQYNTMQSSAEQYSTVKHSTLQYNSIA